jgi:isoquinoline 1-oxidoreductase beta subunit
MTTRRSFLTATASTGAALVVGFQLPMGAFAQDAPPPERKPPNPFNAWIRIDKDGAVTLTVAKSEMGQGVFTSLPMILAEELDVDWTRVRIEQAPTDPSIYEHGTGGSGSIRTSWLPLRQAAAAARQMLVEAAADVWNVNTDTCKTEKGHVVHGPRQKRLAYGELVEAAAKRPLPDFNKVTLKNPDDFQIVGKDLPRADIPSKVDGSARFGIDVRVPGMLYALVARCPTFGGKPAKFDAAKAKAVPGVRHVVEIPADRPSHSAGGIAVVAETTWAARQGRDALVIDWDRGPSAEESSASLQKQFETLVAQPGKVVRNEGDVEATLAKAAKRVEAVYELPFQAHACMEPMNCTVDIRADRAEAWIPTQAPDWSKDMIRTISGLPPEKIIVHTTFMGGGFGRRYQADFVVEAAQVSKAVGAPVQLLWTREDDMQHDFYRPAAYHRLAGCLDEQGQAAAWHHRFSSTPILGLWNDPERPRPLEEGEIGGAVDLPYAIPNLRVEFAAAKTGVPVAWWRSVEASLNAFSVECFLDELAAAAKADPVAFRLKLLGEPRMIKQPPTNEAVLDTRRLKGVVALASAKAGWGKPLPAGRGRGIACHFSFETYVAEVAEVSVVKGLPRVHRVVAAVDCGRVVSPENLRAQVESAIVYGLSATFKGAITIKGGAVEQSNFTDFEVLRIDEMPVVEVHIVPSTEKPTGIGEPALPPIAPAVANALFAATGKRLRRLPITRQDLA